MFHNSGESGHPCCVTDRRGKKSHIYSNEDGIWVVFHDIEAFSSFPTWQVVFIKKRYCILSNSSLYLLRGHMVLMLYHTG